MSRKSPAGSAFTETEFVELIRDVAGAVKPQTVAIKCKKCAHTSRYEVDFPDKRTQLEALRFAHENGYGKAASADKLDEPPDLDVDVSTLSSEQRANMRRALFRANPDLVAAFTQRAQAPEPEKGPPLRVPPRRPRR
jgi:hypothetical protein